MKNTTVTTLIFLMIFPVFGLCANQQHKQVIFNVDQFPDDPKAKEKPQSVMFLGCKSPSSVVEFNWAQKSQKASLPYKFADERCPNGTCTASKYYMASPPVYVGEQGILGQLKPDHFSWKKGDLEQMVQMDYSVLEPVAFGQIHASFDNSSSVNSCGEVALVPINIDCTNLPKIHGKVGASGIGFIKNEKGKGQIFIPHVGPEKHKTLIQCSASILDDIVLGHDIYFNSAGGLQKTISMTALYNNNNDMNFVCQVRKPGDVPAGCLP